jgi:hypothetical protein
MKNVTVTFRLMEQEECENRVRECCTGLPIYWNLFIVEGKC